MKVLIVSRDDAIKNLITYHLKPVGFEIIHYDDPVKAIDNFEELDPEMVLVHAGNFPRHWKPLLKLLRERKTKEQTVFILLKDPNFPLEEAAKASHLGINGLLNADLKDKQEIYRLEELFRRYRSIKDKRKFHRLIPGKADKIQLIFTHPHSSAIIAGSITEISIQGASFMPNDPALAADLMKDQEIPLCSMRLGDDVISLFCQVTRNKGELGLQFKSFKMEGHHKLFQYIQAQAERDLKSRLR